MIWKNPKMPKKAQRIRIEQVLYVPEFKQNLISVKQMDKKGYQIDIQNGSVTVKKSGQKFAEGHMDDRTKGELYILHGSPEKKEEYKCGFSSKKTSGKKQLWHERLGHISEAGMDVMESKEAVIGLDLKKKERLSFCESCQHGKQIMDPFSKEGRRAMEPLELVHSDVCGPMNVTSLAGNKYFLTFVDDFSRHTTVFFMKNKSEVFKHFKTYLAEAERATGKKLKILRSDNGKEYVNSSLERLLEEKGIGHQLTAPYTPQQNGVAERANRTIVEMARTMLNHARLPKKFWSEAVNTAVYMKNRLPTKALDGKTPYELVWSHRPTVRYFRVFGCDAFSQVPYQQRSKFDSKSQKLIFLGYEKYRKAYRLWDEDKQKLVVCEILW